jgi:hypothetical protein
MKKRLLMLPFFVTLIVWLPGCVHTPSYGLEDIQPFDITPKPKIAVAFKRYTGPKFTGNIKVDGKGLAEIVSQHLSKTKLFSDVQPYMGEEKELKELASKGLDTIIFITPLVYEGDKIPSEAGVAMSTAGRISGGLAGAVLIIAGDSKAGYLLGYVTLECTVLKIPDRSVIWKDTVRGEAKGPGKDKNMIADIALKAAVISLVEKLKDAPL